MVPAPADASELWHYWGGGGANHPCQNGEKMSGPWCLKMHFFSKLTWQAGKSLCWICNCLLVVGCCMNSFVHAYLKIPMYIFA